jgi:hypothetical protein
MGTTDSYKFGYVGLTQSRADFDRAFNLPIGEYYDPFVSIACKEIQIDILKFDDWLHKQHGDYEGSMEQLIRDKYGDEAVEIVRRLI